MLGEAIIKGMAVTAKNFAGSYVSKDRLPTIQYPEERQVLSEAVRNFPFLVYDGDDWEKGLRCVSCQICEKECPPKCIYIVKSKDKKPDYLGKPQLYPAIFDIDLSVCMSCGICAEVCPFEAIMMDQDFELSNADRFGGLLVNKEQLARSHDHHMRIRPSEAGPIEERRAAAQAKAKAAAEAKAKAAAGKPADGGD
ncbi:MAG: 4Fe-4S dicluster domain-containing protein [Verrucomicrobia bacterium]|nr:4Fe-4S dicluster domain-containing protein [Verrucomicrobiota bacterium]